LLLCSSSCYKSSFVNESKVAEATKEENLLAKEEPTVPQEHVGLLSLQNIDRNRASARHEAFFEEIYIYICLPTGSISVVGV
jgi:hypothetical protein